MEKGSVVWTLTSMSSGEGKYCVDTNIREEWGVEKGSVVWTLTSMSSGEGKCCVDTNIQD